MSKILWLILLTSCCSLLRAQSNDSASAILQKASVAILTKKISFEQPATSIAAVLQKLGKEQHIRFSYADDRLPDKQTTATSYTDKPVAELLNALLKPAGLSYLMVGRMVVIVKDKNGSTSSTSLTPGVGNAKAPKTLHQNLPGNLAEDPFFKRQPEEVKRKIRKLYESELKWAKRRTKTPSPVHIGADSLSHTKKKRSFGSPLYLKASAGIVVPKHVFKSNVSMDWQKDLQWKSAYKNTLSLSARAGVTWKQWWLETGLMYHQFTLTYEGETSSTYTEIDVKGNSGKISITTQSVNTAFSKSERYQISTVPLAVYYSIPYHRFLATFGPEVHIHFLHASSSGQSAYSAYYMQNSGLAYEEKLKKTGLSAGLNAEAGYSVKQFYISAGLQYMAGLSAYQHNSLYDLRTRFVTTSINFRYFLNTTR